MFIKNGCPVCFDQLLYERERLVQKRLEPSIQFLHCHGKCCCKLRNLRLYLQQCIAIRHQVRH